MSVRGGLGAAPSPGALLSLLTPSGWIKGYASDSSCVCHWQVGRKGERKAVGPPGKPPPSPPDTSPSSVFPTPKNSVAEDAFNNIFLLKKYSNKLSICPSILPCPAQG